jgi:hypothetical protein
MLLTPALLFGVACQATGMGWIPSAYDPTAKATFGFVYNGDTQTFSGSYHDHGGEVDFKGTGVLKSSPPPNGIQSKGGCLLGFPAYESQNSKHPGQGNLFLFVCDMDGDGVVSGTDSISIEVVGGPYDGYRNSGQPSGNITVSDAPPFP